MDTQEITYYLKLAVPADNTNMKELNEKNKSKELKAQKNMKQQQNQVRKWKN